MLLSAVIHLQAIDSGSLPMDLGPAIRSEFLEKWVGELDSKQGDELHDRSDLRPYTISDLNGKFQIQRGFRLVQAGQNFWFRISSLGDSLSSLLSDSVFPNLKGRVFFLDRIKFQVQQVTDDSHPWAGKSSYESLWERAFKTKSKLSDTLDIQFASPTTFRDHYINIPLPQPESVFGSWLDRWNAFSNYKLAYKREELIQAKLVISRYKLETQEVHYKRATWIGFTGEACFRVLSSEEEWLRICNLLANYAFFCGTGAKTSFGLGQTRGIHELDWNHPRPR